MTTCRLLLLGVLLWVALAPTDASARRPRVSHRGPFPTLTVSGSPYRIGKQHGRAFRREIRHNVRRYLGLLAEHNMSSQRALKLAGEYAPVLARHTPALLREIEGIARGSGCTREQILLLNARTELLSRAEREAGERPACSLKTPGCTAVATAGKGRVALGQNWDWRPEASKGTVMLRIKRRGKPALVTLTEAGMVGKIGCNDRRLGVCLNFLGHESDAAVRQPGVPVHVLLRTVMECRTLGEAVRRVATLPRSASANFLIAQQTGKGPRAVDLEATASRVVALTPGRRGHLAHANHFRSRALNPGCERRADPTTLDRQRAADRVAWRLHGRVSDPVARAKRVLMDRSSTTPISRTLTDRQEPTESVTVASVVMGLGGKAPTIQVSHGAPHQRPYLSCQGPGCALR